MRCPFCKHPKTYSYDHKEPEPASEDVTTAVGRRRKCRNCGESFPTVEIYGRLVTKAKMLIGFVIDLWEE